MSDDEHQSTTPANIVYDSMIHAHKVRREFERAHLLNATTGRDRKRLQAAVVDFHDELRRYRDRVEDQWAEAGPWDGGLDTLREIRNRTRTREEWVSRGGFQERKTWEEPVLAQPRSLLVALDDLDDIAGQLGFEADARETLESDEITMEQIENTFANSANPNPDPDPEVATDGGDDDV